MVRSDLTCRRCGEGFDGARSDSSICDRCKTEKPTTFVGVDGEGIQAACLRPQCPCRRFTASDNDDNLCVCGHPRFSTPSTSRKGRSRVTAETTRRLDAGHDHRYVLLGCGDQQIADPDGLHHSRIFTFLYDQYLRRPHAAYVGFFLGYDFTQWLKTLLDTKAWFLLTERGRQRRLMRRAVRPYVAPVRIDEHLLTEGKAFELEWLEGRRLSLRPLVCDCHLIAGASCEHIKPRWMHICDAGAFFQMSLLSVIDPDQYADDPAGPVCTDAEYALIEQGKASRADAALDCDMRRYNQLENEVLARCMGRLDEGFRSIEVQLPKSEWYGPGAASARWLKDSKVVRRETVEQVTPPGVLRAATAAYVGGWFEVCMHGQIPGITYEYDINSAYPYHIARLPCLEHGTWRHDRRKTLPPLEEGALRLVHVAPGEIVGSDPHLGAMLHRQRDQSIVRPQVTGGWYWQHEIAAALRAGLIDLVRTDQGWTYRPCECPCPLAGIVDLYKHRVGVAKTSPAGKAAKLVMNSVYGKFAQGVGARPFGNYLYASLITAGCRTQILDAIASHPGGAAAVVMVATDAVFFTSPHPNLPQSEETLGCWTMKTRRNLTVFKPGVWWHDDAREAIRVGGKPIFKARGINARAFANHLPDIDTAFAALVAEGALSGSLEGIDWPEIEYRTDFALITAQLALHRHRWALAGAVCQADQTQTSDPAPKRH
jgi:hypothetical protein